MDELTPELTLHKKLTGHRGSIYSLYIDTGNNSFYSAGGDGWIVEWSLSNPGDGKLIAQVDGQVFALVVVPSIKLKIAGTFAGNLFFIDDVGKTRNLVFHKRGIFDLLVMGDRLYSAGGDGKLGIWDLEKKDIIESVKVSYERLRGLTLSPDRQILSISCSDGNIYLLHLQTVRVIDIIENAHDNSVFDTVFSSDGQRLISAGRDAHLKVWNLTRDSALTSDIKAHWYTINKLSLHPGGRWLATGSRDKTIRIWDLNDYSLVKSLDAAKNQGHINSVNFITWSDDGKLLYSASDDRSIIIWQNVS